jgi:hypothetical protein
MDPATITLLTTYGVPLLAALIGVVVKHYVPSLGSSILGSSAPTTPAPSASPGSPATIPTSGAALHPLLSRLFSTGGAHPVLNAILQDSMQLAGAASAPSPTAAQPVVGSGDATLAAILAAYDKRLSALEQPPAAPAKS